MLGPIVYGTLGGVYLKQFTLDNENFLNFYCTDFNLSRTVNHFITKITLEDFAKCVNYFGSCVIGNSSDNLIRLERNLIYNNCFGDSVAMYAGTSIIPVVDKDDYCLGVSLQSGDNKLHDFMIVYEILKDSLPEIKNSDHHDELTVYKSYKDGSIKVIYFTKEDCINIINNCRLYRLSSSK